MTTTAAPEGGSTALAGDLTVAALGAVRAWLAAADASQVSWPAVRALEELKNSIVARQAEITVALHQQQAEADQSRGFSAAVTDRLVTAQLALARRRSPAQATRLLRIAHLAVEYPPVGEAMRTGRLSEEQAGVVRRATDGLRPDDRRTVIEQVADSFGETSDGALSDDVRAAALRVDPQLAARRAEAARAERRVSLRSAKDGMAHLSAFLPATDGRACLDALHSAARTAKRDAEKSADVASKAQPPAVRTHRQWMADLVVRRLTGRDPALEPVDVQVNLLMPLDALQSDSDVAYLCGYGPIAGDEARRVIGDADRAHPRGVRVRRLFIHPVTGDLVGMEAKTRRFRGLLAEFVRMRDRRCRSPFCGGTITDIDHITAHAGGGETSERNAQGECSRCNQVKEHPDWSATGSAAGVQVRSGGLQASSPARPLPGAVQPSDSAIERYLVDLEWRWALHREERRREQTRDVQQDGDDP